ncbi:relaxase/mobilization nuclease domain-containing protein [Corynebacterium sanguinis]|uniref:relaxase/mobilization nuclease domain-containing protein n=1 Tax=Corynebacterium sanguinis TaxID=2594913 RepID=UPI0021A71FA2|nr:relaxase/mobilization nuclease domain-containing protein [Corynebacterium sanguinis]MCT1806273.1 relaxase/mobilization nuclease domain-containing protein [Corynebacterium sanguinis]
MPNVVRGDRMAGLLTYLTGPGRANEHTEPHLVAGDEAMMAWHDDDELGRDSALAIARHLDRPRTAYDVDVKGGHVWHCSLSLRADEGALTDEQWGAIARDFITAMEFDDNEGTKAPCRWVAVRHGVSKNGNDHIHIAVNLVREDGTKASTHHDFRRAQTAARALEARYGLEELESVRAERSTRGYNPAEREAQARARARAKYERTRTKQGTEMPAWEHLEGADRQARIASELRTDQPRYLLALKVRGCATAAQDEAEFVRRLRREGLIVRPRFADGRTDVITGFSVAERPEAGERPIWYGGGQLGRDLALPRLRDGWPDTPSGASEAAAEWNAAKRGRRVVAPGRETAEPDLELWDRRNEELRALVDRLRGVDVDDRDTWATVARQTAGALAAWSNATEETPGDLAAAADALSRSAQTHERTVRPHKAGTVAISGAAMLLASAARGGQGTVAQAVMVRQLLRLTQAVYDASVAAGQARQARLLAEDTRARLVRLREALPAPAAVGAATPAGTPSTSPKLDPEAQAVLDRLRAGQAHDATRAASPLPSKIEPAKRAETIRPGADRGPER